MFLAPAERVGNLLDASQLRVGDEVLLKSLAFDAMEGELMGRHGRMKGMRGSSLALGAPIEILKLAVTSRCPVAPTAHRVQVHVTRLPVSERADDARATDTGRLIAMARVGSKPSTQTKTGTVRIEPPPPRTPSDRPMTAARAKPRSCIARCSEGATPFAHCRVGRAASGVPSRHTYYIPI